MNKQELIEAICEKKGLNIEAIAEDLSFAYDEIFAAIVEAVAQGKVVKIPQFGSFHRIERHLGRTRMPSSKKVPDFSPDFNFRAAVSTGSHES